MVVITLNFILFKQPQPKPDGQEEIFRKQILPFIITTVLGMQVLLVIPQYSILTTPLIIMKVNLIQPHSQVGFMERVIEVKDLNSKAARPLVKFRLISD
jgi:hypothetical protein